MMGRLPKDWEGCPDRVDLVIDKFLVFKTPLSEKFKLPPSMEFPLIRIFDEASIRYDRRIGMWIDLTNTNRYYDYREIESNGIEYVKIKCEGHGRVPDHYVIENFNYFCRSFFNSPQNFGQVIAVHCTHGFNRTGYLICSFLIMELNFHVQSALYEFSRFRSPGIYRPEYIQCLVNTYTHRGDDYHYPPTPNPHWLMRNHQPESSRSREVQVAQGSSRQTFTTQTCHSSSHLHNEGQERTKWSNDGSSSSDNSKKMKVNDKKSHEEIDENSDRLSNNLRNIKFINKNDTSYIENVKKRLKDLKLNLNEAYCARREELNLGHLDTIGSNAKEYTLTCNYNGSKRFYLFIKGKKKATLIDHKGNMYRVNDLFVPGNMKYTLLDGNLINGGQSHGKKNDSSGNNQTKPNKPRFVISDILIYKERVVQHLNREIRLGFIKDKIMDQRARAIKENHLKEADQPLTMEFESWKFKEAPWDQILEIEESNNDFRLEPVQGIVLHPNKPPIRSQLLATYEWNFPWKELNFQSGKFCWIKNDNEASCSVNIASFEGDQFGHVEAPKEAIDALKERPESTIECKFDPRSQSWIFHKLHNQIIPNNSQFIKDLMKNENEKAALTKDNFLNFVRKELTVGGSEKPSTST